MPTGWEFVILLVIGIVVLGPERLPEYAAKLRDLIRQARTMAENARSQLGEELGPEFKDVDWEQFDPRRYDPRRIVREALVGEDGDPTDFDPRRMAREMLLGEDGEPADPAGAEGGTSGTPPGDYDPHAVTPYDVEAT